MVDTIKNLLFCIKGLFFALILSLISVSCQKINVAPNNSNSPIHFHDGTSNLAVSASFGIAGTLATKDGGFLIYGTAQSLTSSGGFGGSDVFLMRFDNSGNESWYKEYNNQGIIFGISEAADGGFILFTGGNFQIGSGVFGYTNYLLRTDNGGNEIWLKSVLNNLGNFNITGLCAGKDGSIYTIGNENQNGVWSNFIFKAKANGDSLWLRNIQLNGIAPGAMYSPVYSMECDVDGTLVCCLSVEINYVAGTSFYMARFDTAGNPRSYRNVYTFPAGYSPGQFRSPLNIDASGNYILSFSMIKTISTTPPAIANQMNNITIYKNFNVLSSHVLDTATTGSNIYFLNDNAGNIYELVQGKSYLSYSQFEGTFSFIKKNSQGAVLINKSYPGTPCGLYFNASNDIVVCGTSLNPLSDYSTIFTLELDQNGQPVK